MADYNQTQNYWPANYWPKVYFYWPLIGTAEILGVILAVYNLNDILTLTARLNEIRLDVVKLNPVYEALIDTMTVNLAVTKLNQVILSEEVRL